MSFTSDTLNIDFTTAPDPVLFNADLVASYGRMLDARCDDDCDLDCAAAVPDDRRLAAYREFCDATDAAAADHGETRVAQNAYLCGCVELRERTVDTDDHIIEQTPEFWLGGDGIKVRVCRTFFGRTLGLPNARLDALLEPDTLQWFSTCVGVGGGYGQGDQCDDGRSSALQRRGDLLRRQPYTDFVLNSRKHLDKNSRAFVEETDSDVDVCLDDIIPSAYKNVVNHIQTIPRVVSTWVNQENNQEKFQFESSINCHYMYLNYLKKMKTNKKKVSEKQYKKIYNKYVDDIFMA